MLVLKTICEHLKETEKTLVWIREEPTQDDLDHVLKEGSAPSQFDPLGLKRQTLEDLRAGKAKLVCRRSRVAAAKVLAVVYPGQKIPWTTFGTIFAAFGKPGKPAGKPAGKQWRLVWFANPTPRTAAHGLGPAAVNGGYTYPCRPDTVVIYREEEVCRVLIHELLHAACTDNMEDPVEVREAKTETWAELFLCAIVAGGNYGRAAALWEEQAQWIADQEAFMRSQGVQSPADYSWRYTVARREVLASAGIDLPSPSANQTNSTRLTSLGF